MHTTTSKLDYAAPQPDQRRERRRRVVGLGCFIVAWVGWLFISVLTYEQPNPDTLVERAVALVAVVGTICGAVLCVIAWWVLWLLDSR